MPLIGEITMPFVLQHSLTSQILTCKLVNHYDLEYYGTKFWVTEEEAEHDRGGLDTLGITDPELWKVIEISENQMKLFNVKLKNDPGNLLFVYESKPVIKREE
jgi:hypothetical protein